ncbi:hypothetical protein EVAR_29335_1 [Eumeta japonica]|uniref:Uncharacterized protein n=1 Tax=Eumeta variegata TaxID=151549 RepID=A0A4C1WGL9_EUMVA|nr:hypothetical protein EVAR_29335_1 [Eumeta japonica]
MKTLRRGRAGAGRPGRLKESGKTASRPLLVAPLSGDLPLFADTRAASLTHRPVATKRPSRHCGCSLQARGTSASRGTCVSHINNFIKSIIKFAQGTIGSLERLAGCGDAKNMR